MNPSEAAALLTICAAYDNRKPDADQAKAWALALDGLRFEDCREAIVNHYRNSREWLMPVNVIDGVSAIRVRRLDDFKRRVSLTPPPEFADDPAAEIEWLRDIKARVMDGTLIAETYEVPGGELLPRDVPALGLVGRQVPNA